MLKMLKIFALVALIAYASLCAAVVLVPEYIFYGAYDYPADINQARKNGFNAKEVTYFDYGKNGGKVTGWLYLNKTLHNNGKAIVFLHGNSYNLEHYYHKTVPLAIVDNRLHLLKGAKDNHSRCLACCFRFFFQKAGAKVHILRDFEIPV